MNDMTTMRYCPADLAVRLDADIHPWLLSEREGGNKTTLSYVKVDILTDTLNKLFGPLGWGVEAEIQKMEDFQYEKPGWQGAAPTEMYVFQVISQVKLTIKPQTDAGTPTVFIQSGIGYGEVKINAHRKDAVGMAVKGAESDGLKRCCNFLGRALGMFLVGGKQDPVTYAHNGNKNRAVVNRAMREREEYEERQARRGRGRGDDHQGDNSDEGRREERARDDQPRDRQRDERGRDERPRDEQPRVRQRDEQSRDEQPRDRQREEQPRDRQRDEAPRSETSRDEQARQDKPRDEQPRERSRDEQPARDDRNADDAPRQDEGRQQEQRAEGAGTDEREPQQGRRRPSSRTAADAGKDADASDGKAADPKPEVKARRKASTNYDLRKVPVTRENQQDFGATFIKQMEGMRQPEDQEQMVKTYAQRINELDPDVRALVVARLSERNVDVTLLD